MTVAQIANPAGANGQPASFDIQTITMVVAPANTVVQGQVVFTFLNTAGVPVVGPAGAAGANAAAAIGVALYNAAAGQSVAICVIGPALTLCGGTGTTAGQIVGGGSAVGSVGAASATIGNNIGTSLGVITANTQGWVFVQKM